MPAPYSHDLREKALAAIDRGEKKSRVIGMFGISRDSLDRWLKQRKRIGDVQAQTGYQAGHSHGIRDWQRFREFAQEHGDKTQAEMAQLWSEPVSRTTISRGLKRIGFTRKKRHTAIENGMSKSD